METLKCLPEPLEDEDAKSWFRRFNVCTAANEWNAAKKLVRLPTLLRGRAWTIYESSGETENESYNALKGAIISRLNPDTDEDRLAAREQLTPDVFERVVKASMNLREILRSYWTNHPLDCLLQSVTQSFDSI